MERPRDHCFRKTLDFDIIVDLQILNNLEVGWLDKWMDGWIIRRKEEKKEQGVVIGR